MASSSYLFADRTRALSLIDHPDNFRLDDETGLGIERVRQLVSWVSRKPFTRSYKLILIQSAERLSIDAQNALLKTLEEPPTETFIFVATRNTETLLPTIRSRCTPLTLHEVITGTIPHHPDSSDWVKNWLTTEPDKDVVVESIPIIATPADAFKAAKQYAGLDRDDLIELLDEWAHQLTDLDAVRNYPTISVLIQTKEVIKHNTNIQLALEVSFLRIQQGKDSLSDQ